MTIFQNNSVNRISYSDVPNNAIGVKHIHYIIVQTLKIIDFNVFDEVKMSNIWKYLTAIFQMMQLRWALLTSKPGLTVDNITLRSKRISLKAYAYVKVSGDSKCLSFCLKKLILGLWAAQNRPPSNQIPVTHNTNGFQVWRRHTAPPGGQEVQNVSF